MGVILSGSLTMAWSRCDSMDGGRWTLRNITFGARYILKIKIGHSAPPRMWLDKLIMFLERANLKIREARGVTRF